MHALTLAGTIDYIVSKCKRNPVMTLPETVIITEVGPRDGLQMEQRVLSTGTKIELIADLAGAGVPAIQVAAFVHPEKVPQMADAEAVIAQLPEQAAIQYSALALNRKGVERACRTAIPWIEVSLSASEAHSRQNAGMSVEQAIIEAGAMVALAHRGGRKVRGSIQCAFGYLDAAEIPVDQVARMAALLVDQGAALLILADTTGLATPVSVRRMLAAILPAAGTVPVGLHLHDTRGLGLVNVVAALEMGVARFDTALCGLGGCPFAVGAAGNIATEDTLHLLHALGIETGIEARRVAACSRRLSHLFDHPLSGRLYRLLK
jgi:hydroxymethylglutaryl-CoA lyase